MKKHLMTAALGCAGLFNVGASPNLSCKWSDATTSWDMSQSASTEQISVFSSGDTLGSLVCSSDAWTAEITDPSAGYNDDSISYQSSWCIGPACSSYSTWTQTETITSFSGSSINEPFFPDTILIWVGSSDGPTYPGLLGSYSGIQTVCTIQTSGEAPPSTNCIPVSVTNQYTLSGGRGTETVVISTNQTIGPSGGDPDVTITSSLNVNNNLSCSVTFNVQYLSYDGQNTTANLQWSHYASSKLGTAMSCLDSSTATTLPWGGSQGPPAQRCFPLEFFNVTFQSYQ